MFLYNENWALIDRGDACKLLKTIVCASVGRKYSPLNSVFEKCVLVLGPSTPSVDLGPRLGPTRLL